MSDSRSVAAMMGMSAQRYYAAVFPKDMLPVQAMAWLIVPGERDDERGQGFVMQLEMRKHTLNEMIRQGNLEGTGSIVCIARDAVDIMLQALAEDTDPQTAYNSFSRLKNACKELGVSLA